MDHPSNPPPPQAGKFKPRKPAKKISVGGVVPETVTSTSTQPQQQQPRRPSQGRGGRGGGRGRGSRAPIPQGKAFFTAQPAPQSAGRGNHNNSRSTPIEPLTVTSGVTQNQPPMTLQQQRQARRKRDGMNTGMDDEEIVGTLDEAVGYSLPVGSKNPLDSVGGPSKDHKNSSTTSSSNLERALLGQTALSSQPYLGPNGYIYDSDSSEDDENDESGDVVVRNVGVQRPLTLPFPSKERKDSYHHNNVTPDTIGSTVSAPVIKESKSQFPFLNTDDDNAYFLVQLPTRLPPVISNHDATRTNSHGNFNDPIAVPSSSDPDVRMVDPVAVATPSIQSNAFDNVLTNAKPGRIGKLKIYRSGRTVLVLDSSPNDDGTTTSTPVCSKVFVFITFLPLLHCCCSYVSTHRSFFSKSITPPSSFSTIYLFIHHNCDVR